MRRVCRQLVDRVCVHNNFAEYSIQSFKCGLNVLRAVAAISILERVCKDVLCCLAVKQEPKFRKWGHDVRRHARDALDFAGLYDILWYSEEVVNK